MMLIGGPNRSKCDSDHQTCFLFIHFLHTLYALPHTERQIGYYTKAPERYYAQCAEKWGREDICKITEFNETQNQKSVLGVT